MRLPLLVGLSALVLAPRAGAQGVTEEEFLSGLTGESAAVRALSGGLARAEAARKRAGVLSNPRVDFCWPGCSTPAPVSVLNVITLGLAVRP